MTAEPAVAADTGGPPAPLGLRSRGPRDSV